jgi:protein phosphatase PTC6
MTLTSDEISSLVSREGGNDPIRFAPTPVRGVKCVLSFAENIGSEDNAMVIAVPRLSGGESRRLGSDTTKGLRDHAIGQAGAFVPWSSKVLSGVHVV